MSERKERNTQVLKAALFGATALMLYAKISAGTLALYINPRFYWLPYIGFVILLMLCASAVHQLIAPRQPDVIPLNALAHDAQALSPAAAHTHPLPWWSIALLLTPVVFGLLLPAAPLSASALNTRGLSSSAPRRSLISNAQDLAGKKDRNILDWLMLFGQTQDPAALNSQPLDVIGFVHLDPQRLAPGEFWVSRYIVTCCIADGSGVGMVERLQAGGPPAGAASFKEGDWVRVRGQVVIGTLPGQGERMPVITARTIEGVDEPAQPYLFP